MFRGHRRYREDSQSSAASSSSDDDYHGRLTRFGSRRDRSPSVEIPIRRSRTRGSDPLVCIIDPVEQHRSRLHQMVERANHRGLGNPGAAMIDRQRVYHRDDEEVYRAQWNLDRLFAQGGWPIYRPRSHSPTNSDGSDFLSYITNNETTGSDSIASDSDSIMSINAHHCECCRYNIQNLPPYAPAEADAAEAAEAAEEAPVVPSVEEVEDYDDEISDEPAVVPHNSDDAAVEVPDAQPARQSDAVDDEVAGASRNGKTSRFMEGDMS